MSWNLYKKTRERLSLERGTVFKDFGGKLTMVIAYPNTYYVGMSNLGFQKVYSLLNTDEEILCERVFLPDPEDNDLYQRSRLPLFSLESQTSLNRFDVLAFSLSFEMDSLNILQMLELAHIPLKSEERGEEYPLVLAGGICPTFNPEPMAAFIDLFLIGEAEAILPPFLAALKENKANGESREGLFQRMADCPSVYLPRAYRVDYHPDGRLKERTPQSGFPALIRKGTVADLDTSPTSSAILTPHTEFGNMFLVEVSRGCRHHCRFCLVGYVCQPLRFCRSETLRAQIDQGLALTQRIGLVGAALADYPDLIGLCNEIVDRGGRICPASLRLEGVSPELMKLWVASGQHTVTLAPEAGSERLRRVIHKGLSDEQILEKAVVALDGGISHLKLYFMIGLPTEGPEDVEAIVKLTQRICHVIQKACRSHRLPWDIQLSISPFVPKPFTPFQWEAMDEVTSLGAKLKQVQRGLARIKQVRVFYHVPKWATIQALLSRGDRRVSDLLLAAHQLRGDWRKAFREVNLNPDYYIYRQWEEDELLPWDHLDLGIDKESLKRERRSSKTVN